jgi:hypothetical protein
MDKLLKEKEKNSLSGKNMSEEMRRMLFCIYAVLAGLNIFDNPKEQKKADNCKFPKGVCLAKSALAVYGRIKS